MVATIPVNPDAYQLAVGPGGAVWVANGTAATVSRIDPSTNRVALSLSVGRGAYDLATGPEGLFVPGGDDGSLSVIDPAAPKVTANYHVAVNPLGVVDEAGVVWVADDSGNQVAVLDARSGENLGRVTVNNPVSLAPDVNSGVWVGTAGPTGTGPSSVIRIGRVGQIISTTALGSPVNALAAGDGVLWVATGNGVARIDPASGRVVASIAIPGNTYIADVAAVGGGVWVLGGDHSALYYVDARSNAVRRTIALPNDGSSARSIAVSGAVAWILTSNPVKKTATVIRVNVG